MIDLAAVSNDPSGELYQHATWQINHEARANAARLAKQASVKRYVLPRLDFQDFAPLVPVRRVHDPNPAHRQVYDEMSEQLVRAFTKTRPIFRALNAPRAEC